MICLLNDFTRKNLKLYKIYWCNGEIIVENGEIFDLWGYMLRIFTLLKIASEYLMPSYCLISEFYIDTKFGCLNLPIMIIEPFYMTLYHKKMNLFWPSTRWSLSRQVRRARRGRPLNKSHNHWEITHLCACLVSWKSYRLNSESLVQSNHFSSPWFNHLLSSLGVKGIFWPRDL